MITETEGASLLRRKTALILIGLLLMIGMVCPILKKVQPKGEKESYWAPRIFSYRVLNSDETLGQVMTFAPAAIGLIMVIAAVVPGPTFIRGGIVLGLALGYWLTVAIWSEWLLPWFCPGGIAKDYRSGMMTMSLLAFFGWAAIFGGARARRHSPGSLLGCALGALGATLFALAALLSLVPAGRESLSLVTVPFKMMDKLSGLSGANLAWAVAQTSCLTIFVLGTLAAAGLTLLNIPGCWRVTVPLARVTTYLSVIAFFALMGWHTIPFYYGSGDSMAIPATLVMCLKRFFLLDLPFLLVGLGAADLLLGLVKWTPPASAGPAASAPPMATPHIAPPAPTVPAAPAAPAAAPAAPLAPPAPDPTTPRARLLDLERLLKEGLITQEEHDRKREEIIKEL